MQNIQPGFSNINNIQNQNNINNINNYNINLQPRPINFQTTQHEINQPITSTNIYPDNTRDQKNNYENETTVTNVKFITDKKEDKDALDELNKCSEKTDDTSKNDSENKDSQQNEGFLQKTKRFAGTVWSYINIANYFPKQEFKEYRNANGDWVKIPLKKIPLKKKKVELNDEDYIVSKEYDRDQGNLANLAGDRIPIPNFHY